MKGDFCMRYRYLMVIGVLVAAVAFSGCEKTVSDIKNKFVRKKKGPQERVVRFYDDENERYLFRTRF